MVKVYKDLMEILPSEIILIILVKLDMNDILSTCATNKKYKQLFDSNEDYIYSQLVKRDFFNLKPKDHFDLLRDAVDKINAGAEYSNDIGFKRLIKMGVDINARAAWGETIIKYALENAPKTLNMILDMNPDVNDKVKHDVTPSFCDPSFWNPSSSSTTVLMLALEKNSPPEIVNRILDMNPDVNEKVKHNGTTVLMLALEKNSPPEIVNRILDMNPDVNAKDNNGGCTALTLASMYSTPEIVNRLLEMNADVNAKHKDGCTALTIASMRSKSEIVKRLLDMNPDVIDPDVIEKQNDRYCECWVYALSWE
jgi:hypothetical protein